MFSNPKILHSDVDLEPALQLPTKCSQHYSGNLFQRSTTQVVKSGLPLLAYGDSSAASDYVQLWHKVPSSKMVEAGEPIAFYDLTRFLLSHLYFVYVLSGNGLVPEVTS